MRIRRIRGGPRDPAAEPTVVDEAEPAAVEEEEVVPPPPRPPLLWPWLLLLLLLVAGGLAAAWWFTRDDDGKKGANAVTVPNVVGLKQDAAVARLNDRHLTPRIVSRPSTAPRGTVFAQDPTAGAEVARRSPVSVSVSATAVTSVPNVVGMTSVRAVQRLRAVGLNAQLTGVPAAKPPGTVLSQNPAAGARVAKDSTVSLRVSKGRTTVPDVVGQDVAAARTLLRGAGLVASVFRVPGAQPRGTVVAQKPAGGTKVARGSKVRINVSTGSQSQTPPPPPATTTSGTTTSGTTTTRTATTVRVPNVVGLQQSRAQRRLNAAHLRSRVVYVSSSKPSGRVVSQRPSGGTTVRRRSRVTIRVSLGPGVSARTVPDVIGQDQATATSQLRSAGFTVDVITVTTTDPSQDGVVIDEQPPGGTRAPQGSPVTIYVGRLSG